MVGPLCADRANQHAGDRECIVLLLMLQSDAATARLRPPELAAFFIYNRREQCRLLAHRDISLRRKTCRLLDGGLNRSTQHFIFEGKDGV